MKHAVQNRTDDEEVSRLDNILIVGNEMNNKIAQGVLIAIGFLSIVAFCLDIYPKLISDYFQNASLITVLICNLGFLASFIILFAKNRMSLSHYILLSLLFLLFFNLFFLSLRSTYASVGLLTVLICLFFLLLKSRKRQEGSVG